jgi:hypothetical protein
MSRYVPTTLAYNHVYLAGRKQGGPTGWKCFKKTAGTNTPSKKSES